jgi:hypothetical protein
LCRKIDLKFENFKQENNPETKNDLLHTPCLSDRTAKKLTTRLLAARMGAAKNLTTSDSVQLSSYSCAQLRSSSPSFII